MLPQHLRALLEPDAYAHPTANIHGIETHISRVVLTADLHTRSSGRCSMRFWISEH